jgi:hypothetical protein
VGGVTVVIRTGALIRSLTVDANHLYWTSDHDVRALPLGGGPSAILASATDSWPQALRGDGAFLYWLNRSGQVMRLAKPGGSGGPPAVGACAGNPGHAFPVPMVDSSGVWWVSSRTQQLLHDGLVVSTYTNDPPNALALDTNDVYTQRFATAISRQPKSGGPSVQAVNDNASPASLVVSGSYLYWIAADVAIKRMPLSGGPVETLVTGQTRARSLVVDGGDLYWLTDGIHPNTGNGRVKFLRGSAGTPVTLAEAQMAPSSITVDAQNVYWINGGTSASPGAVMRLAKSTLP